MNLSIVLLIMYTNHQNSCVWLLLELVMLPNADVRLRYKYCRYNGKQSFICDYA